mmetsp:Transcript_6847/g.8490  ORF Transcript_6847/g.8490 Transcript_6847/m.8490 type:complete len:149 (+) Transcript_6847:133-579(+)|eukprot:CAMPEP_0172497318 /NCGR_PEP_ID=MMETSP1066-20121228/98117_1 /TAXON_ID=671091 /ORGANISM="Coscinodiscus wailesii, Strain CCMP2513" /LENGTH=148 /DNA_ID=CAMNT_0013270009 /DNA_START=117 /DNA_END=563 /DNA_ORIENTATION=+
MSSLNIKVNLFILFVATACSAAKISPGVLKHVGILKQGLGGIGGACLSISFYDDDKCEGKSFDTSMPVADGPGQDMECNSNDEKESFNNFYCAADGFHFVEYANGSCSGEGKASVYKKDECIMEDGLSAKVSCVMDACPPTVAVKEMA